MSILVKPMKHLYFVCFLMFAIASQSQTKVSSKLYAKDLKNASIYFDTEDYLIFIIIENNFIKKTGFISRVL